eukprot:NODE_80_length_2785_cov_81.001129_g76_i0.p1 GENE.NODE_80_length_2785_cov_81.001129_g76_i0~~NODE_80_length_2785_cov_81.001129_g76_i0.p1  ORF type:complete len:894 (-),score=170.43 NODE_80_length_2785_cov_81.001129_g76_i0:47-2728(-)
MATAVWRVGLLWALLHINHVHLKLEHLHTTSGAVWRTRRLDSEEWVPAVVPGSVLTTLVANGVYPDPYFGVNLMNIPDMSKSGRAAYTYVWQTNFTASHTEHVWLKFRGVNSFADVFCNGALVGRTEAQFHRYEFDITHLINPELTVQNLTVVTFPPMWPGVPGGQGGNETINNSIGMNAAAMQCMLGWDWAQAVPDRNTGIWDAVQLLTLPKQQRLLNPHVTTTLLDDAGTRANITATIVVESSDAHANVTVVFDVPGLNVYETRSVTSSGNVTASFTAVVANPTLWWPHNYGTPHLYDASFRLVVEGAEADVHDLRIGVREVGVHVWHSDGWVFSVNRQQLFLRGGNWIATDSMLRYSTDAARYRAEVQHHQHANLDVIRVWGGGLTERPEFYDACDEYGVLVWQEFWMTGDVNGAWGPDREQRWTYPMDHQLYLDCAADNIRMLRNHPSLLVWVAGNELQPHNESPPADIRAGLPALVAELDGTRPYFQSSMNKVDGDFNNAVSSSDGPYILMTQSEMFQRNAGLGPGPFNGRQIAFNPEAGSVGVGNYESLLKWMSKDDADDFPSLRETKLNPVWDFHKYESYYNKAYDMNTTSASGDFIYAYGTPTTGEEYCLQAQICNYVSFRGVFEGYNYGMWTWYTGIIMWKSQTPWPAMRGNLYDWYLGHKGTQYGVRASAELQHVQLAFADGGYTTEVGVTVNYRPQATLKGTVSVMAVRVNGSVAGTCDWPVDFTSAQSYHVVRPNISDTDCGPKEGEVRFLFATVYNSTVLSRNVYWRSSLTPWQDFRELETLRSKPTALDVTCKLTGNSTFTISVGNPEDVVAFFVRFELLHGDTILTPTFFSDNYVTLAPQHSGALHQMTLTASSTAVSPADGVRLYGYNVKTQDFPCT